MRLIGESPEAIDYADTLRFGDTNPVNLSAEGEVPDRVEAAELAIPFHRLSLWSYDHF